MSQKGMVRHNLFPGLSNLHELVQTLQRCGFASAHIAALTHDTALGEAVRAFVEYHMQPVSSDLVARPIMRELCSIDAVLCAKERDELLAQGRLSSRRPPVPYSQAVLEACKETHMLVPVPALSLSELCSRIPDRWVTPNNPGVSLNMAQDQNIRACRRGGHTNPCYWLVRKHAPVPDGVRYADEPVPFAKQLSCEAQRQMLPPGEILPPLSVLMCAIIAHHTQTGEMLFAPGSILPTSDTFMDKSGRLYPLWLVLAPRDGVGIDTFDFKRDNPDDPTAILIAIPRLCSVVAPGTSVLPQP